MPQVAAEARLVWAVTKGRFVGVGVQAMSTLMKFRQDAHAREELLLSGGASAGLWFGQSF